MIDLHLVILYVLAILALIIATMAYYHIGS